MPRVSIVQLDLQLPEDATVDLVLFQLRTPPPLQAGGPSKLPDALAARRGDFLTAFATWMTATYCQQQPPHPLFIVAPELSIPLARTDVLEAMLGHINRPTVVIAGLEFLRWSEYRTLIEGMANMPNPGSWLENGQETYWVNAALILVRDNAGVLHRFIQPKRNPSDAEAATHFPCRNVLLFQSHTQTQGLRLNFCVQICADFTSHEIVKNLRRACEQAAPGRPLDFTFVLQRNENQAAPHFKRSVQEYFAPPVGMVETARGALIFLNNARAASDGAAIWGDSMLLFPYQQRWRTIGGAPTYWLKDDGPYNHQAVLMRETGSAAFWLRYRPQYLVNPIPGSGQPGPFVDALALSIMDDVFPPDPQFRPIPPVGHWLRCQWADGCGMVKVILSDAGSPEDLQIEGENAYNEMRALWDAVTFADDEVARILVGLYFCCFTEKGYPEATSEPREWLASADEGARRFLATFALVRLGVAIGAVVPRPSPAVHALVGGMLVTLVWGDSAKTAGAMIVSVLRRLADVTVGDDSPQLVVLVRALDTPDQAKLAEIVQSQNQDITKAEQTHEEAMSAASPDITQAAELPLPTFVCDQRIWAAVCYAESVAAAHHAVSSSLGLV